MSERPDEEQPEEEGSGTTEGSEGDGNINGPLTNTDVEAPRKSFGS